MRPTNKTIEKEEFHPRQLQLIPIAPERPATEAATAFSQDRTAAGDGNRSSGSRGALRAVPKKEVEAAENPLLPTPESESLAAKAGTDTTESTVPNAKSAAPPRRRVTAEMMAGKQREISVSEFFTKNRHLLGFDNPQKALLTAVKEAVDNSLDACEEAGILPVIRIEVIQLEEDRYRIRIEDNGPGIVKAQIPRIFGKLLYGSKFHTLKQARGQQGIGISAAGMYGQLTTGTSIRITSATGRNRAHYYEIQIDTRRNAPDILVDRTVEWDVEHGTLVELDLAGVYKKGRHSVDDYIEQTAIANPHAAIHYLSPDGQTRDYPAAVQELPPEPREIKPHPYGVELGILMKMLKDTKARTLGQSLSQDFSRVSPAMAEKICAAAELRVSANPHSIATREAEKLYRAISRVKIMNPPTNCLSPIGEEQILKGLQKQIQADFFAACTRPPTVYRGNPFQIEAGLAYGGNLPQDQLVDLMRFANRVPLSYQQSACAISKAVMGVEWRGYGLGQNRGALPNGPAILFVHIASVWVPFTSESKEAIAGYPEIIREIRLALQEIGRKLQSHVRRHRREAEEAKKRGYIEKFIPHIGIALREILGLSAKQENDLVVTLKDVLEHSRN